MQSTKITRNVLNADALAKAVAEMEAILAQMDASSVQSPLVSSHTAEKTTEELSSPGVFSESISVTPIKASEGTYDSDHTNDSGAAAPRLFLDAECGTSDSDPDSSDITVESKDATKSVAENLKVGYVIFPKPMLVNKNEKRTYQVGTFDGKSVYHYWSRAEQFLSSFEYATPFGKRFLFDEPDSVLPPEDETDANYQPSPGVWWPGPGNANMKFQFQRYFDIRPSKLGGLGAYATTNIEIGKVILVERPLLLTTHANVSKDVLALPPAALAIYKSFDGNQSPSWIDEIKNRNCFDVRPKIGFFAIASRFNHACGHASSISYTYDHYRKVMAFAANKNIEAGTELTINYGAPSSACLYAMYGFVCRCGACRPLTRRDLEEMGAGLEEMGAGLEERARWGLVSRRETVW